MFMRNDEDFFNLVELPALRTVFKGIDPMSLLSPQSLRRSFKYPYDVIYRYTDEKHEQLKEVVIKIALAGFEKDEVKIKSDANVLTVNVDPTEYDECEADVCRTRGISRSKETISFTILDKFIDIENSKCKMENGILTITVPYKVVDNSKIYRIE